MIFIVIMVLKEKQTTSVNMLLMAGKKKKKNLSLTLRSTFDLQVIIVGRDTSSLVELGAVFFSIPPVGFGCDLEAPPAPL